MVVITQWPIDSSTTSAVSGCSMSNERRKNYNCKALPLCDAAFFVPYGHRCSKFSCEFCDTSVNRNATRKYIHWMISNTRIETGSIETYMWIHLNFVFCLFLLGRMCSCMIEFWRCWDTRKIGVPRRARTSDHPFRGLTSYPLHHATPAVCFSLSLLNHIGGVISYQQSIPLTGLTW